MANNSVVVKIDGDDSGFKKSMSDIGKVAKKSLGVAVKGIAATSAAIGALSAASVKCYADYEQLTGGVETLFKTSSDKVMQYAKNAYKTAGLSANEYMETVTSFSASLLQSLGGDTEKAADYAHQAITDMSDNANKMGTDMSLIQNAYQGFAKQNYTMLDNLKLGYGGTKEEMARLIKDAAKLDKSIKANDMSFGNIVKSIHAVQENMDITGTTAKEAATTISGSIGMMKASWTNLLTGMSDKNADIDKLFDDFADSIMTVFDNLLPVIETSINGIGKFIAKASESLIPELIMTILNALPGLINAAKQAVVAFAGGLTQNADQIAEASVQIVKDLAEGILAAVPVLLEAAVSLVGAFLKEIAKAIGLYKEDTSAAKKRSEASKELRGEIEKEAKAYDDLKRAQTEKAKAELADVARTEVLFSELKRLTDANGKVKESYEARANFILGELNSAYGKEYKMIDGVIVGYQNMQAEIDNLIEKKKWEIAQKAALPAYEEAYNKQIEARLKNEETKANFLKAELEYQELMAKVTAELNDPKNKGKSGTVMARYSEDIKKSFAVMEEARDVWDASEKELKELSQDIYDYEEAMTLASEGRYEEAMAKLSLYTSTYSDKMKEAAGNISEQRRITEEEFSMAQGAVETYLKNVASGTEKFNEGILRQLLNHATEVGKKGQEIGANLGDGTIAGFNGAQVDLLNVSQEAVDTLINGIVEDMKAREPEVEKAGKQTAESGQDGLDEIDTTVQGKNFAQGFINGVNGKSSLAYNAGFDLATSAHSGLKKGQQEGSPSKLARKSGGFFTQGFVNGITSDMKSVESAGKVIAKTAIEAVEKPLKIHSPSGYARDEIGKMYTKGIAVGINQGKYEVSEATKALFDDLELQRDLNVISEAEYYKQLEYLRDEHIKAGTKEWWDYTKELISYSNDLKEEITDNVEDLKDRAADAYSELADDAIDKMDAVLDKQEDFKNQLRDMSDLYSEGTEKDAFGNDKPVFSLTDWEKENKTIEAYNKTLTETGDRLKTAFGDDSKGYEELMQIIRDGGMEEGLQLMTLLRQANDEDFLEYVRGFQENRRLTDEISSNYFKEERDQIGTEFAKDFNEIRALFEAEFDSLPEEFFKGLGEDSASEFGKAFMLDLEEMLKEAKTQIDISMSKAWSEAFGPDSRNAITYNSTYYVQPANGESTNAQLKSIREAETLNRMRE